MACRVFQPNSPCLLVVMGIQPVLIPPWEQTSQAHLLSITGEQTLALEPHCQLREWLLCEQCTVQWDGECAATRPAA